MKLSDIEKGQLMVLYHIGFRFIVRDESVGLCAYQTKPRLYVFPGNEVRFWFAGDKKLLLFLNDDLFNGVRFDDSFPYQITKSANLRLCKPTKKVVNV